MGLSLAPYEICVPIARRSRQRMMKTLTIAIAIPPMEGELPWVWLPQRQRLLTI